MPGVWLWGVHPPPDRRPPGGLVQRPRHGQGEGDRAEPEPDGRQPSEQWNPPITPTKTVTIRPVPSIENEQRRETLAAFVGPAGKPVERRYTFVGVGQTPGACTVNHILAGSDLLKTKHFNHRPICGRYLTVPEPPRHLKRPQLVPLGPFFCAVVPLQAGSKSGLTSAPTAGRKNASPRDFTTRPTDGCVRARCSSPQELGPSRAFRSPSAGAFRAQTKPGLVYPGFRT